MNRDRVVRRIGDEALFADGFDAAIIGYVERFGLEPLVLYNREKCIEILAKEMSYDEAEEHFEFNVIGAWVGDNTPAFATILVAPKKKIKRRKK